MHFGIPEGPKTSKKGRRIMRKFRTIFCTISGVTCAPPGGVRRAGGEDPRRGIRTDLVRDVKKVREKGLGTGQEVYKTDFARNYEHER